jgi:hypothetical protein
MFKNRIVELEVATPQGQAKTASQELGELPATFDLVDTVEVNKVKVTKVGKKLIIEVGTDDGHYLALRIK